jgi:hypothetical protein
MKSFKEFIADDNGSPEDLEEGLLKTASIGVLGARHRNLKTTAIQRLKGAAEAAGKVRGQKDTAAKLDLLADALQEQNLALINFGEMSGVNFSASAVAAVLSNGNSNSHRGRR